MALPGFDIQHFPAAADDDGLADARTTAWNQATSAGFHDVAASPERMRTTLDHVVRDGREYISVYDAALPTGLDGLSVPVGTYASFTKSLNVGGGRMLDAHLITGVTVRPTHRRRGILRELITNDLASASEAVALLTVSEASIYRRFGFGKATFTRTIRVDTGARFGLVTAPGGRVETVEAGWLREHLEAVFAAFHAATPGSLDRTSRYTDSVLGTEIGGSGPAPSTRAAVHLDDAGTIDGYVTYKAVGEDSNRSLEVVDLVAATTDSYLGLWQFLGAVDLVNHVRWDLAPVDDPLTWALRDSRAITVESVDDVLWARILDPIAAFEARAYLATQADALVRVHDALGHADGLFRFTVRDGSATVERVDSGDAALTLDVSALGSLLLGSARPSVLAAAGEAMIDGDRAALDLLFAPLATPYCIAHF
ncbi:GNAT family N-acetyltransferase [Microbacteriaceae bacterium VKM Ac-2855]|nr:GNAT family N-acetyltransferase [Microbacteriaceae bacterium VKM Ac-2855]